MSKVAIADDSAPVELEGGQVIINKQASKKHWRYLSKINQSAGDGVPLHEPQFKKGGGVGEPYDSMTKYQLEKGLQKLTDEWFEIRKSYSTNNHPRQQEIDKEKDKIITLLYGENFSGKGQKFKYAKGGAITNADLNRMIKQYNSEGRSFELRGAYGNYELWSKGNRLEVGSKKDIYNALVKYRFNDKYEQGGSIGFIPMDLEEKLALLSKWGGTNIRGVLGLLNAMIDTGIVDEDLVIKPTKNTRFQREKAIEKKIQEIWEKIQPRYNQELKGNMYYSTLKELIGRNFIYKDILQRFKPFRKYQKFEQGGSTDCECYHYEIGGL